MPKTTLLQSESKRRPAPQKQPRLKTLDDIAVEMARCYRQARRGDIEVSDGTKYIFMLTQLARVLEAAQLERRVHALEVERD